MSPPRPAKGGGKPLRRATRGRGGGQHFHGRFDTGPPFPAPPLQQRIDEGWHVNGSILVGPMTTSGLHHAPPWVGGPTADYGAPQGVGDGGFRIGDFDNNGHPMPPPAGFIPFDFRAMNGEDFDVGGEDPGLSNDAPLEEGEVEEQAQFLDDEAAPHMFPRRHHPQEQRPQYPCAPGAARRSVYHDGPSSMEIDERSQHTRERQYIDHHEHQPLRHQQQQRRQQEHLQQQHQQHQQHHQHQQQYHQQQQLYPQHQQQQRPSLRLPRGPPADDPTLWERDDRSVANGRLPQTVDAGGRNPSLSPMPSQRSERFEHAQRADARQNGASRLEFHTNFDLGRAGGPRRTVREIPAGSPGGMAPHPAPSGGRDTQQQQQQQQRLDAWYDERDAREIEEERNEPRGGGGARREADLGRELLQRKNQEGLQPGKQQRLEDARPGFGDGNFGGGGGGGKNAAPVQLPLAPASLASKPDSGPPLPPARSYRDAPVELPPPPQMMVYGEGQHLKEGFCNPPQQQQPGPHFLEYQRQRQQQHQQQQQQQQQQIAPHIQQQEWRAQLPPEKQAPVGATNEGPGAASSFPPARPPPQLQPPVIAISESPNVQQAPAASEALPLRSTQEPPQPQQRAGASSAWAAPEQKQATSEPLLTIEQRRAASEALWRQVTGEQQLPGASRAIDSAAEEGTPPAPPPPPPPAPAAPQAAGAAPSAVLPAAPPSAPLGGTPVRAADASSAAVPTPGSSPDPRPPLAPDSPAAASSAAFSAPDDVDSPAADAILTPDRGAAAAGRPADHRPASVGALQKQRSALRNWRSALYDHALVLLGAARLPRKALAGAAKMPGAVWVDRHELAEPSGLPLQVKSVLARSLAAQTPACGSCDDSEAGRDFVLLMTFVSAEDKTAAVGRLTEVGVDTSAFDNSPRIQVEHARAASAPLPPPPSPPPRSPAPPPPLPQQQQQQQQQLPPSSSSAAAAAAAAAVSGTKIPAPPLPAAPAPAPTVVAAAKVPPAASTSGGGSPPPPIRKTGVASTRVMLAREKALKALQVEKLIAAEAAKARSAGAAALERSAAAGAGGRGKGETKGAGGAGKKPAPSGGKVAASAGKQGSKRTRSGGEVEAGAGGTGPAAANAKAGAKKAKVVPDKAATAVAGGEVAAEPAALPAPAQVPAATAATGKVSATGQTPAVTAHARAKKATVGDGRAARRSPSPVPPEVRRPPNALSASPPLPKSSAALSSPRGVSPVRRGTSGGATATGFLPAAAAAKALSKRLLVMRPRGPPDPTRRPWPYDFSGEYFKLLDRGPSAGACDPSKNASYVGVVLSTEAVVAGFAAERESRRRQQQQQQQQQRSSSSPSQPVATAEPPGSAAAAAVASLVSFTTAVGGAGASSGGGSGGGVGDSSVRTSAANSRRGAAAEKGGTVSAAGRAAPRSLALAGVAPPDGRDGASVRGTKRGVPSSSAGGAWDARIQEAEDELKALRQTKIPRVMETLSDVSVQRRKLESLVASVAAKSAAASARLAQDSRDSAAALLAELRARREATKVHRQNQRSQLQQQQQQQQLREHGGSVAESAPIPASASGLALTTGATAAAPAAAAAAASATGPKTS